MKYGIISDTHDNIWRLEEAIPHLRQCAEIFHCGDLISPFMVSRLGQGVGATPVHMVWGNNDGDRRLVSAVAGQQGNFIVHGDLAVVDTKEMRIAISHYPEIGKALAYSQLYDLVCFGHNHTASLEQINKTVLLNPGEVMGLNGRSTIALFDVQTKEVEFIELDER